MKYSTLIFIITFCASIRSLGQKPTIDFITNPNWEKIQNLAKKEKKIIFADMYASWCVPCKKMDAEVYTNDSVINLFNQKFISLKLQVDSTQNDDNNIKNARPLVRRFTEKHKVRNVPTFLFFNDNGKLIYKTHGFLSVKELILQCQNAETSNTEYMRMNNDFIAGKLTGINLLNFAVKLKRLNEDSLSMIVANTYKRTVLYPQDYSQIISIDILPVFSNFTQLFSCKDSIVKYIYRNGKEIDKTIKQIGFSDYVIKLVTTNQMITPGLALEKNVNAPEQLWDSINGPITKIWDPATAKNIILDSKIQWYTDNQKWDSLIKYQMEKFDNLNDSLSIMESFQINNFIYDVVLKYSEDKPALKKACKFMERVTETYPEDHQALDTYANVLYKYGQKEKAMSIERKALHTAVNQKSKEIVEIYKQVIEKMEKNIPTWH